MIKNIKRLLENNISPTHRTGLALSMAILIASFNACINTIRSTKIIEGEAKHKISTIDFETYQAPDFETAFDDIEAVTIPPGLAPKEGVVLTLEDTSNREIEAKGHHSGLVAAIANITADKASGRDIATYLISNSLEPTPHNGKLRAFIQDPKISAVVSSEFNSGVPVSLDNKFWREFSAFVVRPIGNIESAKQKNIWGKKAHRYSHSFHLPPLVVHVGRAAQDQNGDYYVGDSSWEGPTFVAPERRDVSYQYYMNSREYENNLVGTSFTTPEAAGTLAALDYKFGNVLTREHILYAVCTTCDPITPTKDSHGKRPHVNYLENAAGYETNFYAGFGMINLKAADNLLLFMTAQAREHPETLTHATTTMHRQHYKKESGHTVIGVSQSGTRHRISGIARLGGIFTYDIEIPTEGLALKTTLHTITKNQTAPEVEYLVSPSGTRLPVEMFTYGDSGLATTHGFLGEPTQGTWQVLSRNELTTVTFLAHSFGPHDLIQDVTPETIKGKTLPADLDPDATISIASALENIHTTWQERTHNPTSEISRPR